MTLFEFLFPFLRNIPGVRAIHGHKWMLEDQWEFKTDLRIDLPNDVDYLELGSKKAQFYGKTGWIILKPGFTWDGPSGPTIDTDNWLKPSAEHDALYAGLKFGVFKDYDVTLEGLKLNHEQIRKYADDLMYERLVENGVHEFRAGYSWAGVRVSPWASWEGLPWSLVNYWM